MIRRRWLAAQVVIAAAVATVMLASCSGADPAPRSSAPPIWPVSGTGTVQIAGRTVTVHLPGSYDPAEPAPLVLGLHGYTSDAAELESYLRLTAESDRRGFVYAYPDGSADNQGEQFWNASEACCAFSDPKPDDSRILSELIAAISDAYRIDRARVYLIGHSNGGFMTFRMACDHADQVTAIASLNGAGGNDASRCRPSEPVSVLAIHSSADETVAFEGGDINGVAYPSAATTVSQWVRFDGCVEPGRGATRRDLVTDLPAAETSVLVYDRGCAAGATVQAWTINGGPHVPQLGPAFSPAVLDFLLARTKRAR